MLTETTIHASSVLERLCRQEALINTAGKGLLRAIPFFAGMDGLGKSSLPQPPSRRGITATTPLKGAMLHAHIPSLRTRRIVTAYAPA